MTRILTLYPDTFLWEDGVSGLLYNAKNYQSYEFLLTPFLSDLSHRLLDFSNLYSVDIEDEDMDEDVRVFLCEVERRSLGVVREAGIRHPLSLPPLLCLQRGGKGNAGFMMDESLLDLTSVLFYMGGNGWPGQVQLQTEYPFSSSGYLQGERLLPYLEKLYPLRQCSVRLLFSDMAHYPGIGMLMERLSLWGQRLSLSVRASEADLLARWARGREFRAVILHDVEIEGRAGLDDYGMDEEHVFFVKDAAGLEESSRCAAGLPHVRFVPLFTGSNRDFFEENVFLTREDLLSSRIPKRIVFAHGILNTHYYGKLEVMPDGKVYSLPSKAPLGDLDSSLHQIVRKEQEENHAWRVIRNKGKCVRCLYRYLCPSPTFQEELMGVECVMVDKVSFS